MPAPKVASKLKICKSKKLKGSARVPCDVPYTSFLCPNRELHILPAPTGYCSHGWCEGTKPKDWRGNPVPTCSFILTCPCACHTVVTKMFEMSDLDRILVENPEYTRKPRSFWLPSDDPDTVPSNGSGTLDGQYLESVAPDVLPGRLHATYAPTPTGRAARGELEQWVEEQCDIWVVEAYEFPCTPVWLAEEIGHDQAIDPPSVGAINSVFNRWEKLGFAVIGRKPVRFLKYTDEGVDLGLAAMKARVKRSNAARKAAMKRGIRV